MEPNQNIFTTGMNDMSGSNPPAPPNASGSPLMGTPPMAPPAGTPGVQQTQPEATPGKPGITPQPMPPKPQPMRKSLFDRVLQGMAGGPTRVDGQEVPMNKKSLTAHILAGAITGIISGAAASANAPAGPAGTNTPGNFAALAGGLQGTQAKLQQLREQPQKQLDDQRLRQFNTMHRNIELHTAMLNLGQLQHKDMMDAMQPNIDLYNQADSYDQGVSDPSKKLILDRGLTGPQALQKYAGKMSMSDFLPMGTKKMYNDDGSPMIDKETGVQHEEPIFAVVNPDATMPVTDELKEQLKFINPNAGKIPSGAAVRVQTMMNAAQFGQNSTILKAAGNSWGKEISEVSGDKSIANVNLSELARTNKTIRDGMKFINSYNYLPVDEMLAKLKTDKDAQKAAPGIDGVLAHALGMDKTNDKGQTYGELLGLKRKEEIAKQRSADEEAQRVADNKNRRILHQQELEDAASIKEKGLQDSFSSQTPFPNNWKDPKTGTNYDLSHPSVKLVEGTLSPSELSKRATKGSDSYNNIIKQADDYSQAKYLKPFDFQKADTDYKYSAQKGTKDTLNLIQSLTGEGAENNSGTLAQLDRQAKLLGNTTFPNYNALKQWTETHIGEPGVPAFQATLFGVADEMAKILGGGTATVEGFKQAQAILDRCFSNQQASAAIAAVRGNMANRSNGMIGDNVYLTKQYGKMRNPLEPNDIPRINGVIPVAQGVSKTTGQTYYKLPSGVVVDRKGQTVNIQ